MTKIFRNRRVPLLPPWGRCRVHPRQRGYPRLFRQVLRGLTVRARFARVQDGQDYRLVLLGRIRVKLRPLHRAATDSLRLLPSVGPRCRFGHAETRKQDEQKEDAEGDSRGSCERREVHAPSFQESAIPRACN